MFGNNPTLRFPGNLMQVRSINELRGVSPYEMNDEAAILVTAAGLFTFDASSLANDDGATVIRPNGFTPLQSGRWVSPVTVPSLPENTFSTLAALQAANLSVAYLVGDPTETDGVFFKSGATSTRQSADSIGFVIGKSVQQKLNEEFSLSDIPLGNYSDDNGRLLEAQEDGRRKIKLLTAKGSGSGGEWVIRQSPWVDPTASNLIESAGNLYDGLELYGEGPQTVVFQSDGNYIFSSFVPGADDPATYKKFHIHDLTLRSDTTRPHSEPEHQVAIHRYAEARFDRVRFIGSRSDGIWSGMGPKADTTAMNGLLHIKDCLFDGVNNQSRNAVSPESVTDFLFSGNTVRRFTTNFHPGGVDFEPRAAAAYATRNARIIGNLFENGGGAPVCFFLNNPDAYNTPPGSMIFAHNHVNGYQYAFDLSGGTTAEIQAAYRRHDIKIVDNIFKECGAPRIKGMFGVDITNNRFINCGTTLLGGENGQGNREVRIEYNSYIRPGRDRFSVWNQTDSTFDCSIRNNYIWDAGKEDQTTGYGFLQSAGLTGVDLSDNTLVNPAGRVKLFAAMVNNIGYESGAANIRNRVIGTSALVADNYTPPAPVYTT